MRGVAACLISWLLASGAQAHHSDKLDWHFDCESGSKVAFYGVPESHNVALSIRCEKPGTFYLNIALAHAEIGRRRQGEAVKVPLLIDLPDGERQAIMVLGKVEKDDEAGDIVSRRFHPGILLSWLSGKARPAPWAPGSLGSRSRGLSKWSEHFLNDAVEQPRKHGQVELRVRLQSARLR